MGVESYMHKAAKDVLTCWLREVAQEAGEGRWSYLGNFGWRSNRGPDHWGVWQEYPITAKGVGHWEVWDEIDDKYLTRPPTLAELRAAGTPAAVVLDVAVYHKGNIGTAFEICHKHPVPMKKKLFLYDQGIRLIELPARWVLGQVRRPRALLNVP